MIQNSTSAESNVSDRRRQIIDFQLFENYCRERRGQHWAFNEGQQSKADFTIIDRVVLKVLKFLFAPDSFLGLTILRGP